MRTSLSTVLLLAGAPACAEAPDAIPLEASARSVTIGEYALSLRVPEGSRLETSVGSARFSVRGRGGADILLTSLPTIATLAEAEDMARKQSTPDGDFPEIVRAEEKDGAILVVSRSTPGKLVRVHREIPAGKGAISCYANVTRSRPITDLAATQQALEEACASIAIER